MCYQLISKTTPVARKAHRCIWCGEPIPAGTRYINEFSRFDGEIQKHRWHTECLPYCFQVMREDFGDHEFCFDAYCNPRPQVEVNEQEEVAAAS